MSLSNLNSIGQTVFELESRNGNFEGQTKNGQTNGRNYTNLERNLAMMVIYLPVDWTNRFRVKSPETESLTDKRTELHQFQKELEIGSRRSVSPDGA